MLKKFSFIFIGVMLLALILAGCGGGEERAAGDGDPKRGQALYEQTIIGSSAAPGCVTCQRGHQQPVRIDRDRQVRPRA